MPQCHQCLANGERSERCLRCAGPGDTDHHGESHVSLDAMREHDPQTYADAVAAMETAERRTQTIHPAEAAERFGVFAQAWMRQDRKTQRILLAALNDGLTHAKIARRMRMGRQAVSKRIARALKRAPALRGLIGKGAK